LSRIIAIEYAKIFRNLGADVTLVIRDSSPRNALSKIGLDPDIAATLVADLVSFMQQEQVARNPNHIQLTDYFIDKSINRL
jgi:pyruvate/2-oxoglutarate dehydrogenase complex dihydrolipoamide dehydrogenase (E3) component